MIQRSPVYGMRTFFLIWFGQLVSLIGSGLTGFALGVWVYQRTGSVTLFAFIALSTSLPGIIISPLAGAFVDRWDRRWVMLIGDSGAGLCTLALVLLLRANRLEVWHIYIAMGISSAFSTFQWLAYSAAITMLVPKEHMGRASGMVQVAQAIGYIVSPALAGILVTSIHIWGVVFIDFVTFLFAVLTLLIIRIPQPQAPAVSKGSLLRDIPYGLTYITMRPGLIGLLAFMTVCNFIAGMLSVLATPLVLSFASPTMLGIVLSVCGSGMLIGGLIMSIWGGPKRRVYGVIGFMLLAGFSAACTGLRPSIPLLSGTAFAFFFSVPVISASNQAIWQCKVAPGEQGRVFALRQMISMSSISFAQLVAGPLADHVFEPLLAANGLLSGSLGQVIGVGPGRGVGLMFIVTGVLTMLISIVGYLYPRLRLVDQELPDAVEEKSLGDVKINGPMPGEN